LKPLSLSLSRRKQNPISLQGLSIGDGTEQFDGGGGDG